MSDTKSTILLIRRLHLNFIVIVVWKISFHFIKVLWCPSGTLKSLCVFMGQKHIFEVKKKVNSSPDSIP